LGAAKVMQFSADSMQCHKEHMNAICNYVGNAEIVQGQDKLTAPKITTYQNDKHEIYQVIAEGNPANYHTEDATRIMNATAQVIKLYPLKNFAVFIGNAEVIDGKTKCDGEYLEYDMVKKTMISHPHKTNLTKILIQS